MSLKGSCVCQVEKAEQEKQTAINEAWAVYNDAVPDARGQAKGLTWFQPGEDPSLISKQQIMARLVGALGGRAAEEVIFGDAEVTTGASGDLQQVGLTSPLLLPLRAVRILDENRRDKVYGHHYTST